MAKVYLGLGSNIEPVRHLRLAIAELRRRFGDVETSSVYRNAPIGFEGDDFLNMVALVHSRCTPEEIIRQLEEIHSLAGRPLRAGPSSRELDIDLLLYDGLVRDGASGIELPRSDVLEYDFVLRPLAELAPDHRHPVTGRRLADHWRERAAAAREMNRESIEFHE